MKNSKPVAVVRRRPSKVPIALFIIILVLGYIVFSTARGVGTTKYVLESDIIPSEFDGFKILQVSDYHCGRFKDSGEDFIKRIKAQDPDVIVLTGDMMDEAIGDMQSINALAQEIVKIAPVYSVSGNHDRWYAKFNELQKLLEGKGVVLLENKHQVIKSGNSQINIYGIADPGFWDDKKSQQYLYEKINALKPKDGFNILLFHRANMLDDIKGHGYQLVLSGHMHGGQVQIPFLGGLKSPHGEWFPEYAQGRYDMDGTTMIVSRGLGNNVSFPRILNPPELVLVTLKKKS